MSFLFLIFREGDNEKVGFSPQNDHPLHFSSPGIPQPLLLTHRWVTLLILIHGEVVRGLGAWETEQLNPDPDSGILRGSRPVTSLPGSGSSPCRVGRTALGGH